MAIDAARTGELCALIAQHYSAEVRPHLLARAVVAAQRAASIAKRAGERACNYGETERQTELRLARQDRAACALETDLRAACDLSEESGGAFVVELGGDPRGPCGRLVIKGLPGDSWGGGYGLY